MNAGSPFARMVTAPPLVVGLRVIHQLRRDRRSLALALGVPVALLALLWNILEHEVNGQPVGNFDLLAPPLISTFVFLFVFVLSVVSFLRERTEGTFERLLTTPTRRGHLILGYMLGFLGLALAQSGLTVGISVTALGAESAGPLGLVFLVVLTLAIAAVSLGVMLSTFARTELQAVQFVPLIIVPQVLLAGTIFPVEVLPDHLEALTWALPLRYGIEATRAIMIDGSGFSDLSLVRDWLVLVGFAAAFASGAALAIRRL